jgi:hypothetical protein
VVGRALKAGEKPIADLTFVNSRLDVSSLSPGFMAAMAAVGLDVYPSLIGFPSEADPTVPVYKFEDGDEFCLTRYKEWFFSLSPQFHYLGVRFFTNGEEVSRRVNSRLANRHVSVCRLMTGRDDGIESTQADHGDGNTFGNDIRNCSLMPHTQNLTKSFQGVTLPAPLKQLYRKVRMHDHPEDPAEAAGLFIMFRWVFKGYKDMMNSRYQQLFVCKRAAYYSCIDRASCWLSGPLTGKWEICL